MGQLTASIAHEVKQPIAGERHQRSGGAASGSIIQPPNLEEARQALACAVNDGIRAAEVIDRIRELVKEGSAAEGSLGDQRGDPRVIELTRGEAVKNGVSVQMQLAEGLPLIRGRSRSTTTVMLNLIVNAIQAMTVTNDGLRELLIRTGNAELEGRARRGARFGSRTGAWTLEHVFEPFHTTKPDGLGHGAFHLPFDHRSA